MEKKVNLFKAKCDTWESETICLDFDGVIHKNSKGFHDGTIYDDPIDGSLDALKSLYEKGYKIIISTCKANPNRPFINGKTGIELIWDWLKLNNIDKYVDTVTNSKPNAKYYVDDKAIEFENWTTVLRRV